MAKSNYNITLKPLKDHPLVPLKQQKYKVEQRDAKENKLIKAFILTSVFWLIIGSLAGQIAAIKFIWPDALAEAALSFGRLRPVHTNTVFWGWASLAMLGLGYYAVPSTSSTKIFSLKLGWISYALINISLVIGDIAVMLGVNNGMQEYREFIWPIMGLFMLAIVITTFNYYKTIANRNVKEIYISNWFIMGACFWTLTFMVISYLPFYQNGLGETIIQGYYMHMAVGMWFMTLTLGLMYYFLPKFLNKPIYSYSLGIVAFWTQMLFYTMIGTHHFVFSPIPWWMQTVAIVFSIGMIIPVAAGTINFAFTFKGSGSIKNINGIYFIIVGIIFYFLGSFQGSLQALRSANLMWHFTDYTIAHSHMTMYGIITFMLWGMIYGLVPRLTGKEANPLLVNLHFWLALIGLIIYVVALIIGGSQKGLSWMDGKPFLESIVLMKLPWLWRALGGLMMFISHLLFAYNVHAMFKKELKH